jgi:hypothetical protein
MTMTNSDPGKIAEADQTAARQFDEAALAAGISVAMADHNKTNISTTTQAALSPVSVSIWERFRDWLKAGEVLVCGHEPLSQPSVFWLPWKPALVCLDCCNAVMAETNGTVQDKTCDGCGAVCENGILMCSQVRSGGVARDGTIMPPVTIAYGLCRACDDVSGKGKPGAQG